MSQTFVDQVTLDCLLNKSMFNAHIKNKKALSINKEDKKFYKKRIYNLFKELLINKLEPDNLLPDVKYAYDNFINASINYFKTIDNNDLLQEEYKTLDDNNIALENIDANPELGDDVGVDEADKLLMRSIKITPPSLDKYVKRKSTKPEEKLIMPKQKEINLMNPDLKVKGIQSNSNNNNNTNSNNNNNIQKKENITNKYDEIINAKNENDKKDKNSKKEKYDKKDKIEE
jgi:hypothetical protein